MTPLARIIRAAIDSGGPMRVADYMALCLGHPEHGYYATRDPLGAAGDFTTAPEISQMFGEMAGLWLASIWIQQGRPDRFRLVELGPGRGTLINDALRAAGAAAPGFETAADLWLVETSPALRNEQAARVEMAADWANAFEDVPDGPTLLIANEFFDALPIRQFVADKGRWFERVVGLEGDRLMFGLGQPAPMAGAAPDGAVREVSPQSTAVAREIGRRIADHGGAALIVDYGYADAAPLGDTLQAVKAHAYADPLATPGEADLTAHVDFAALAAAAHPARAYGPVGQGAFLAALGIGQRAAALAGARPDQAGAVADALTRLTDPAEMGTLFKALAILPDGAPPPPGFEEPR